MRLRDKPLCKTKEAQAKFEMQKPCWGQKARLRWGESILGRQPCDENSWLFILGYKETKVQMNCVPFGDEGAYMALCDFAAEQEAELYDRGILYWRFG